MAEMNDRVLQERVGTRRLNDVFLKIYPRDRTSKCQELECGLDLTFLQSCTVVRKVLEQSAIKFWLLQPWLGVELRMLFI